MEDRPPNVTSGDPIPEPEPAHVAPTLATAKTLNGHGPAETSEDERELEATELRPVRQQQNAKSQKPKAISRVLSPGRPVLHWYDPIRKLWRHQIRLSVPHVDCRDHLANERTYLGYLRTSLAFSMIGIVIAQLYRLGSNPDPSFGYYAISKPISCIFQGAAMLVGMLGTIRYFRQQNSMAIGRAHAGGFEILTICISAILLVSLVFALQVAIEVYTDP